MIHFLFSRLRRTNTRDAQPAQGLVEYALILLLVAIGVVGALTASGARVSSVYQQIADAIPSGQTGTLQQKVCVNGGGNPVSCGLPAVSQCYIEFGPPTDGRWVAVGSSYRGVLCA